MTLQVPERSRTRVVLADGRRAPIAMPAHRRVLLRAVAGSVVAVLLLLAAGAAVGTRLAERAVLDDASRAGRILGETVIEPNITAGLLSGDPAALTAFARLVDQRLVPNTAIVRVKIWSPRGRVVFSNDSRDIGNVYPLDHEELTALREGTVLSSVSDLSRDESRFERHLSDRLIEVYTGIETAAGQRLLFESYFSYSEIEQHRSAMLRTLGLLALGGLTVLVLFQLALGMANVRWVQRRHSELQERSRMESDRERRRVARDLHDGVVQDLVGASYAIGGAVDRVRDAGLPLTADELESGVRSIRAGIQGLRSTLIEIYPATLRGRGLPGALADLVEPLRGRGIEVDLEVDDTAELRPELESLVYRCAREAVRNVTRHSQASRVWVSLRHRPGTVELVVRDDGCGLTLPLPDHQLGHLGIRSMVDDALEQQCLLELASAPGAGTELRLVVPS